MSGTRRRFSADEGGVSEVVGYLFSFVIAFMILVASMATFQVIAESGDRLAAQAEFGDVANRVAAAILDAFEIGAAARDTVGTVTSGNVTPLLYQRSLDVPPEFRGFEYTVEVDARYVYVNSTDDSIRTNSTTFKADQVLDDTGSCAVTIIVCAIEGSVPAGHDAVVVSYRYDPTTTPPVNKIEIS